MEVCGMEICEFAKACSRVPRVVGIFDGKRSRPTGLEHRCCAGQSPSENAECGKSFSVARKKKKSPPVLLGVLGSNGDLYDPKLQEQEIRGVTRRKRKPPVTIVDIHTPHRNGANLPKVLIRLLETSRSRDKRLTLSSPDDGDGDDRTYVSS
ncbi:hypothetical protein Q7C36_006375 [Tachysurus vachellii]|uniref:Uncharacterized protein n=1 Tax=Tachysurus vachellii TaxID=175792 RepID=A0AA88NCQ5_TACVA|nr:hypothetical protein Q7C36_006375 [Tachysurus vachellii]